MINNFFGENNFMADTSALAHRTSGNWVGIPP